MMAKKQYLALALLFSADAALAGPVLDDGAANCINANCNWALRDSTIGEWDEDEDTIFVDERTRRALRRRHERETQRPRDNPLSGWTDEELDDFVKKLNDDVDRESLSPEIDEIAEKTWDWCQTAEGDGTCAYRAIENWRQLTIEGHDAEIMIADPKDWKGPRHAIVVVYEETESGRQPTIVVDGSHADDYNDYFEDQGFQDPDNQTTRYPTPREMTAEIPFRDQTLRPPTESPSGWDPRFPKEAHHLPESLPDTQDTPKDQ